MEKNNQKSWNINKIHFGNFKELGGDGSKNQRGEKEEKRNEKLDYGGHLLILAVIVILMKWSSFHSFSLIFTGK